MKLKRERNQAQKVGEEEEEETVWGTVSSDGILRLLVLLYALEPWRYIYGLVTTAGLLPHADMQDASCRGWS